MRWDREQMAIAIAASDKDWKSHIRSLAFQPILILEYQEDVPGTFVHQKNI